MDRPLCRLSALSVWGPVEFWCRGEATGRVLRRTAYVGQARALAREEVIRGKLG